MGPYFKGVSLKESSFGITNKFSWLPQFYPFLIVPGNRIGSTGILEMAPGLQTNTTLTSLDLTGNNKKSSAT